MMCVEPQITIEMDPRLASKALEGEYRRPGRGRFLVVAESVRDADQLDVSGDLCHSAFRSIRCEFCRIADDTLD